jgi:hypothetical protein
MFVLVTTYLTGATRMGRAAAGATVIVHGRDEAKLERVRAETETVAGPRSRPTAAPGSTMLPVTTRAFPTTTAAS